MGYEEGTDGTEQCRFERPQIKKLFKNRPRCEITLGNEMDLDHFWDTFFEQNVNFFDVVVTWYFGPTGDFAPLPCTVYLVINNNRLAGVSVTAIKRL